MTKLIVGVCGGSASGKTTFARRLKQELGADRSEMLLQDSYYIDQSEHFDKDGGSVNFDHPSSIDFELMAQQLAELKQGKVVEVPVYDFSTHKRLKKTQKLDSPPIVIIDGMLILHKKNIREHLDLSVFIHTEEDVRFQRRLDRDIKERGRTPEGVRDQFYAHVNPMHDQFVEPSKVHADKIYSGEEDFNGAIEEVIVKIKQALELS